MGTSGFAAFGWAAAIASGLLAGAPPAAQDIVKGTGPLVQPGDVVTVDFDVTTLGGKEAANTLKRGLPYSFVLGDPQMPPMWTKGLAGMRVGGERVFTATPDLAFGDDGLPPIVPAGATLSVHVWVLKVKR